MLALQTIQAGEVIKQRLLKKPILVHKGQRVSAAVEQRGFRLTTEVVPLEDGANGDTIKVRNAVTEKLLWARITPAGDLIIN